METITNNLKYFLIHCETNAEHLWKCNGTFEASSRKRWVQSIPRSIDGAGYGGSDLEIIAWLISEPGGFDGLLKIHELQSLYWGYVLSGGTPPYTSTHSKALCPIFSLRILHICFVCLLQMCDWSWHFLLIRRYVVSVGTFALLIGPLLKAIKSGNKYINLSKSLKQFNPANIINFTVWMDYCLIKLRNFFAFSFKGIQQFV